MDKKSQKALISYAIYSMSNPAAAFKDEIDKLNKR